MVYASYCMSLYRCQPVNPRARCTVAFTTLSLVYGFAIHLSIGAEYLLLETGSYVTKPFYDSGETPAFKA